MKVGESTERLVLHSSNLGSCYYELILKATISKPEKPLYFCTMLGSNQTITTKIMNYNRQKTEYMLQVSVLCSCRREGAPAAQKGWEGALLDGASLLCGWILILQLCLA